MKNYQLVLLMLAVVTLISIGEAKMIKYDTIEEIGKIKPDTVYLPNPKLDTVYLAPDTERIEVSCDHSDLNKTK